MKQLKLRNNQKGVSLLEYALIAALVAVIAITALTALGTNVSTKLGSVNTSMSSIL